MTRVPAPHSPGSSIPFRRACANPWRTASSCLRVEKVDRWACRRWRSDVHVDHGGFQPGMPHEVLDLAQRNSRLNQMGRIAVPQQMWMHSPLDTRLLGCITQSLAHHRLQGPPPAKFPGFRMSLGTVRSEHVLPLPGRVGLRALSGQGEGKIHPSPSLHAIALPKESPRLQMNSQTGDKRGGEGDLSILVPFARAYRQDSASQVDVLGAKIQKFSQPHSTPVLHPKEQIPGRRTPGQQFQYGGPRQHRRQPRSVVGIALVAQLKCESQHPLDEPSQRISRQGQTGRRQIELVHQAAQKFLRLRRGLLGIHRHHRMSLGQSSSPIGVGGNRVGAIMLLLQGTAEPLMYLSPILGWDDRIGNGQGQPDPYGLVGLPTLPCGKSMRLQPRGIRLRGICRPGVENIRLHPSKNPLLIVGPIHLGDPLLQQGLPVPYPLRRQVEVTLFFAKREIAHNTKFYALSASCQAPTPPSSPTRPTITPNHPNKPQFRIRTVLGRPSGRDFAS